MYSASPAKITYQHTLAEPVSCVGVGLHTGKPARLTIMPAVADSGHVFVRRDVEPEMAEIRATWYNVTETHLSTTIANRHGIAVSMVEHVLAALYACGVDNATLVLDGPEVPSVDGSAKPFVDLIEQVGLVALAQPRKVILVEKEMQVEEDGRCVSIEPSPYPWVEFEIDFENPAIGQQHLSTLIDGYTFSSELAAARTFGLEHQIATLQDLGFAQGGSMQNAILVGDEGILNPDGLRFKDEFVRHKILDAIGDLALAGGIIIGKFNGYCSGHSLNNRLLHALMADSTAWRLVSIPEARAWWRNRLHGQGRPEVGIEHRQQMSS